MQPATDPFHPSVVSRLAAAQEAAQRDPGYASQYYRRRSRLAGLRSGLGDWTSFGGEVRWQLYDYFLCLSVIPGAKYRVIPRLNSAIRDSFRITGESIIYDSYVSAVVQFLPRVISLHRLLLEQQFISMASAELRIWRSNSKDISKSRKYYGANVDRQKRI